MCRDIETLVHEIKSILFAVVPQNMLLLVRVAQLDNLTSNEIADVSPSICEGEAYR